MRLKTTKQHKEYWENRTIDWKTQYFDTWNHPHRSLLVETLRSFRWLSLWEVGVGAGANLAALVQNGFQDRQLGGSDVSKDAIDLCRKMFTGGLFHVESTEDLLMSDKATDVILSDATLIYVGPEKIRAVLKEITRVARVRVVLCEFHSTSFWKRWAFRWKTGYNSYDYKKLLEDAGCYDVQLYKIPPEMWPECKPGDGWYDFGYIITAKV